MESYNNFFELENQFILRMPSYKDGRLYSSTSELAEILKTGSSDLKDRLFIDLDTDTRKGLVKFDNEIFKARLVDLPCIIESLKTVDKKTFYKTSDICQMLICKANDGEPNELFSSGGSDTESSKNNNNRVVVNPTTNQEINKKYLWTHGITAPLKNSRKKRFRKVAKKKIIDYAEIEAEVKRLFKTDREAIKVDYEVLYVDEPQQQAVEDDEPMPSKKSMDADESLSSFNTAKNKLHDDVNTLDLQTDESNDMLIRTHSNKQTSSKYAKTSSFDFLIGDVSSSSDSDDGEESLIHLSKNSNKKMVKISKLEEEQRTYDLMDADESTNLESPTNMTSNRQSLIQDINDDTTNTNLFEEQNSNIGLNDDSSSLLLSTFDINKTNNDRMSRLVDELDQIRVRKRKQEDEINQINNPVLKHRLLPLLNDLIEEEKNKNNEIDSLRSLMNE
jgi:transcription initiation factor TFIID subunit 7